jgi:hypothetical protein
VMEGRGSDGGGGNGGAGPLLLTVGACCLGVGGCHWLWALLAVRGRRLLFVGTGHCSWALSCRLWAPSHCLWVVGLFLSAGCCSWVLSSRLWVPSSRLWAMGLICVWCTFMGAGLLFVGVVVPCHVLHGHC